MEGKRFIRSIRLENILSYGPGTAGIDLLPLNVLIGPNASGKSNLIEVLSLLSAAPQNLHRPITVGGRTKEWLWKGVENNPTATVTTTVDYPRESSSLIYKISFTADGQGKFVLLDETLEEAKSDKRNSKHSKYYQYRSGNPSILATDLTSNKRKNKREERVLENISPEQSILSQLRDPNVYPELTHLTDQFVKIMFYREWDFGHYSLPRGALPIDLPSYYLTEDASNLSLVLSNLINDPNVREKITNELRSFYLNVEAISSVIEGGAVQINLYETGLQHPVPLLRLSDGTLRYLSLLTVLCHPDPPPIICIEEPETGLHPDIIPGLAGLLKEASNRSQIIVTTHSEILVDSLTDIPESIIVCEKPETGTQLRRLNKTELEPWLKEYRLGDLWTTGELGGNRW